MGPWEWRVFFWEKKEDPWGLGQKIFQNFLPKIFRGEARYPVWLVKLWKTPQKMQRRGLLGFFEKFSPQNSGRIREFQQPIQAKFFKILNKPGARGFPPRTPPLSKHYRLFLKGSIFNKIAGPSLLFPAFPGRGGELNNGGLFQGGIFRDKF